MGCRDPTGTRSQLGDVHMNALERKSIDQLFGKARSYKFFSDRKVDDENLRQVYALAALAPSSNNSCPMRIVFARSDEARGKIIQSLSPGNVEKTRSAPVTAIIAHDLEFYRHLPLLAPHMGDTAAFERMPAAVQEQFVLRNSSIQGGIFMIAARLCGLDCGPMSGFNNAKIDELFFANSSWRSNFLINLGYGTDKGLHPRGARLAFEDACLLA